MTSSKNDYLLTLRPADRRKLESSYQKLTDTIDQKSIHKIVPNMKQMEQELEELLQMLENGGSQYALNLKQQLAQDVQTWKQDTITRNTLLKRKSSELKQSCESYRYAQRECISRYNKISFIRMDMKDSKNSKEYFRMKRLTEKESEYKDLLRSNEKLNKTLRAQRGILSEQQERLEKKLIELNAK